MNEFVHVAVSVRRTALRLGRLLRRWRRLISLPEPMTVNGSLANGANRFGSVPCDTEFASRMTTASTSMASSTRSSSSIDRLLLPRSIAIHDAQECGKCKFDCDVPWDVPFCRGRRQDHGRGHGLQLLDARTSTIELSFAPVNPPACGNIRRTYRVHRSRPEQSRRRSRQQLRRRRCLD